MISGIAYPNPIIPLAWPCTILEGAGAHLMEEEITLLVQEEAARFAWIKAWKDRYAPASCIKCAPKEEVVHWSKVLDNDMEDAGQAPAIQSLPHAPLPVKRGSEHQKVTNAEWAYRSA
jgi:hypothetical protein